MTVLGYDHTSNFLYGLSIRNKAAILVSKDGSGGLTHMIETHQWKSVAQKSTIVTPTEVPLLSASRMMSVTLPQTSLVQEDKNGNQWGG